jgi:kynureninase
MTEGMFQPSESFAQQLDAEDPLRAYRERFSFPKQEGNQECIYMCGNSLGLMPKTAKRFVEEELEAWQTLAVDGHFQGRRPWFDYHELFSESAAQLVGAQIGEVVIMNSLTVNLHLMMVSFYRPTADRFQILIEETAFPSDRYAVQSQAKHHGFDPEETIVVMKPREGENLLRTEDIESYLENEGSKVALVLFGGVNFYTGQAYDMKRIAAAAHQAGAYCGFDLAHAAGNLHLKLHDWNVDFAPFCTYKYINAGPGAVAGCFVHARHGKDLDLPRFAGWWGIDPKRRFEMPGDFTAQEGADGWQLSNAPILSMATLLASLEIFEEVGMEALRAKSVQLTRYLLYLVDQLGEDAFDVISPRNETDRGSQISLRAKGNAKTLRQLLQKRGVISDFRPPDVIRVAPVPLYNSYLDIWKFVEIMREAIEEKH